LRRLSQHLFALRGMALLRNPGLQLGPLEAARPVELHRGQPTLIDQLINRWLREVQNLLHVLDHEQRFKLADWLDSRWALRFPSWHLLFTPFRVVLYRSRVNTWYVLSISWTIQTSQGIYGRFWITW
jgi:hypothetical protein